MLDLSEWAVVSFNDDTGLGRMAVDLKKILGVGWHFVAPSERLQTKPLAGPQECLLPPNAPEARVRELLGKVRGIIVLERSYWHPDLLRLARETGVMTVCCPMWEWFGPRDPKWAYCDLFICTSRYTRKVLRRFGYANTAPVGPWPLDRELFPDRQIRGSGRTFFHNAGLVGGVDRKGTGAVIRAFNKVKRDDIRLIVRMQKASDLPALNTRDPRVEIRIGNLETPGALYGEGEVAVQPSKLEGLGLTVVEPQFCGIPTITTDYPPMNEYITNRKMLVRPLPFKREAYPTKWHPHAHHREPSVRSLAGRIAWCAMHDLEPISEENRAFAHAMYDPDVVRSRWDAALSSCHLK